MGQKVNPHGIESRNHQRLGIPRWYAEKDFADYLVEDHDDQNVS